MFSVYKYSCIILLTFLLIFPNILFIDLILWVKELSDMSLSSLSALFRSQLNHKVEEKSGCESMHKFVRYNKIRTKNLRIGENYSAIDSAVR